MASIVAAVVLLAAFAPSAVAEPTNESRCRFFSESGSEIELGKVRLGGATRDAFLASSPGDVVATCPPGPGVLMASVGTAGLTEAQSVSFRVGVESSGEWRWLHRETVGAEAAGWVDWRVELASEPSVPIRLRLQAVASDGADAVRAYWGSVRVLPERATVEPPPNIVLVSLDTLGAAYLGSFGGNAAASRNIDSFLNRAFSFRRAYAPYPNTLVSHASLFSGLYPSSHGVYGGVRDSQVEVDLLSTVLRRDGYLNVAFTENAFVSSDFGFDRDFDWYDNGPEHGSFLGDAKETFGKARKWLERYGQDAPFLLFVHTYEVHSPYITRDEESRAIADEVFSGSDIVSDPSSSADMERLHNGGFHRLSPDEIRRLEALHIGEIRYLDRQFAELIEALEGMPFAERTLLVVFGDHGDEFDPVGKIGHGETLDDVVMHVPLAFYLPGRFRTGSYRFPVSLVDVAPTVLDFLGKSGAFPVDGRSLLPLLKGEVKELAPRPVFAELQKAEGTCQELHLSEDCYVGRFVAYTRSERFETSTIPSYQELRLLDDGAGLEDPPNIDDLQALLSAYVTGSPWDSQVPWRPRSVEARRQQRPAIDEVTRQRLEALGYDF